MLSSDEPRTVQLIKLPTPSSGLEGSRVFVVSVWKRSAGGRRGEGFRVLEATLRVGCIFNAIL
jgi:hypothetical protein